MAQSSGDLSGRSVLIVEDDPLIVMLLEDTLIDIGCEVAGHATRLQDGIDKARSLPLDAAIIDINLNGQRSYVIAEALMARGIPVVFATGYDLRSLPAPFDRAPLLAKPFRQSDLKTALLAALNPDR